MRKRSSVLLSALLITSAFSFTLKAEANSEVEELILASTKKEIKEILKDGNIAIIDLNELNIEDILDELKIGLKIVPEDSNQLEAVAIMSDDDINVPIYLYGENNNAKLNKDTPAKSIEAKIKNAVKKYKQKSDKKEKKDADDNLTLAAGSNYIRQGSALKITSSLEGTPFWYTEYRVYESSESDRYLDYYYLRADHDFDGQDLPNSINDLTGFKAQWWADQSGMDLLDPEPKSDSNQDKITIGIPGGVSWDIYLEPNLDINLDFELDTDHAVWEVENYSLSSNLPISNDNKDFDFTKGGYIESDDDNDGFRMNVFYEGWTDFNVDFNDTSEWNIRYDIIFEDSQDDIDMG
ncbi:hypothetical protein [Brevibacillus porteri]|uniref:hypothetical protein n=1 Tax=Brevibacillus porteri TaxID=2126350 RepID=UPI00362E43A1